MTDLHAMAEEAARELFSGYQNEIAVAIIERALIGGLREAADESGYGAQFEEAAAAIERLTARVKELEAGRAMTGLKIDRSEAVNLARDWLDSQAPKGGMHITNKGIKTLAEAVMNMDAAIRALAPVESGKEKKDE